jgi:predicted transcriptional regulator
MNSLSKKDSLVYQVMQSNPITINNDSLLIASVWEKEGYDYSKSLYENLKKLTRPETITRSRRRLKELGLITYSEKADKERYEAFKQAKDEHKAVSWLKD